MTQNVNFRFDLPTHHQSIIKVIGLGGGGSNAVNYMFHQGIKDVEFMVCNTDYKHLELSEVPTKVQLGRSLTQGLGAGARPEYGRDATIESLEDIKAKIGDNTKMVFITAGMGGGTGTGSAPIVARLCKEMGLLTVGIVTMPFKFEGRRRMDQAHQGLEELRQHVDTLIVILNDKVRETYGNLPLTAAFSHADNVLCTAAKGIAEIITVEGYVNVDFADVQTVLTNSGVSIMGSAEAEGENRAIQAIESALNSPLLNDTDIRGAKSILLNITSGLDEISLDEIGEIIDYIQDEAGLTADVIWGNCKDESLDNKIRVTVIATGFEAEKKLTQAPTFEQQNTETKRLVLDQPVSALEVNSAVLPDSLIDPNQTPELPKARTEERLGEAVKVFDLEQTATPTAEVEFKLILQNEAENTAATTPSTETPDKIVLAFDKPLTEAAAETPETDMQLAIKETAAASVPELAFKPELNKGSLDQARERLKLLQNMNNFPGRGTHLDQDTLENLERQPAYLRRGVSLDDTKHSDQSTVSKFMLQSTEAGARPTVTPNSHLHDRAD